MNPEELLKFIEAEMAKLLEGIRGQFVSSEELAAKIDEVKSLMKSAKPNEDVEKKFKELESIALKQGEEIAKMQSGKKTSIVESRKDLLKKAMDNLEKKGFSGSEKFVIKTDVTRAAIVDDEESMHLSDVARLATSERNLESVMTKIQMSANSHGVVTYTDQTTATRNAASVAEGAQYPESAIAWRSYRKNLEKVGDSIPVTVEALKDVAWMQSELDNFITNNLELKVENLLAVGNGTTPNITGVYTYATAFDTVAYAASTKPKVSVPNVADLMAILKTEITATKGAKYNPNIVIVNPYTALELKLLKAMTGDSVVSKLIVMEGDQLMVAGMRVVENSNIAENTLVLGDFRFARIYTDGTIMIEIGEVDKQFIEDTKTLKGTRYLLLLIRNADADAFIKVTNITTAKTAITA